jgi:putative endonuclease
VYILKSEKTGSIFFGSTANLDKTLSEHNSGKNLATMSKMPWEIIYKEEHESISEAVEREKYLKSDEGYAELKAKGVL